MKNPDDLDDPLDLSDLSSAASITQATLSAAKRLGVPLKNSEKDKSRIRATKGAIDTGTSILAGGSAVAAASSLTVAATSGAGIASGLAAAGSVVGGGMAAGPVALSLGPTYLATRHINKTFFSPNSSDSREEISAKNMGRVGTISGAALGTAGAGATVIAGGASGAAIMSTLATVGGVVGGGAIAGVCVIAAAPVVVSGTLGYGMYRYHKKGKKVTT